MARRPLENDRGDEAPRAGDRRPGGRAADDVRRPGSGRDHDRVGGHEPSIDHDADRRVAVRRQNGPVPDGERRTEMLCQPRVRTRRRRRRDRVTDVDPASNEVPGKRRLQRDERRTLEERRSRLRVRDRPRLGDPRGLGGGLRRPDQQQPARLVTETERVGQRRAEIPVQLHRVAGTARRARDRTDAGRCRSSVRTHRTRSPPARQA